MEVSVEDTATITGEGNNARTPILFVGRHAERHLKPLQEWRLKRALRFVDEHLEERISLASMAKAAGLTRMHFAAQFRLATGVRPHDYVLHRKIERACEFLSQSRLSIVEVALSVGFQSQAHFTTVFKRLTGSPPLRWRQSMWCRSNASTGASCRQFGNTDRAGSA